MTPLYENQYIGAFIYALGVVSGKEDQFPASLNLFQQTPLDKKIGDLFGNWNGRNFIIEFKRFEKDILSELKKPARGKLIKILKDQDSRDGFWSISNKGHFICYGKENLRKDAIDLVFRSYVSLAGHVSEETNKISRLKGFISQIISNQIGMTQNELVQYLKILDRITPGASGFSGLIVNIDKNGMPNLIRFDNPRILDQKINQKISRNQSRGISM